LLNLLSRRIFAFALLALLYVFVLTDFVGDGTSASACCSADERAFAPSGQTTDYGASNC
jgi:hypothetical protein